MLGSGGLGGGGSSFDSTFGTGAYAGGAGAGADGALGSGIASGSSGGAMGSGTTAGFGSYGSASTSGFGSANSSAATPSGGTSSFGLPASPPAEKSRFNLDEILQTASQAKATDVYFAAESRPVMSIHGRIHPIGEDLLSAADTLSLARQAMTEQQDHELRHRLAVNLVHSGDFGRFRFNIYFQRGTIAMVARLIRQEILTFNQLGLPEILGTVAMEERGIGLVTGAAGSGKSTTLAAMIGHRNEHGSGHIVTIEDPVEFLHDHNNCIVSQREVGTDTPGYHEALKDVLRQAPTVILIGEIRDGDTARFSLHAAETGHLVLATLHTINASQTLERMLNFFPSELEKMILLQLSLNIRAIVSQRLVPTKDGGRACAVELLLSSPRIRQLIQSNDINEIRTAIAKSADDGMVTFDMSLYELFKEGLIPQDTALRYADMPNDLRLKMGGFG